MKINVLLWKKLFVIQPVWCTAKLDKFCAIYVVVTKEMVRIWHFWQELLKSTSKMWKPRYDWVTWWKQQREGTDYVLMENLNLVLRISAESCFSDIIVKCNRNKYYLLFSYHIISKDTSNPNNIYLLKVNNRNSTKRCETCSNLTVKTPKRRHSR